MRSKTTKETFTTNGQEWTRTYYHTHNLTMFAVTNARGVKQIKFIYNEDMSAERFKVLLPFA